MPKPSIGPMLFLYLVPPMIAFLVLAAHFFRSENLVLALISVLAILLALVRRPWAARTMQVCLVLGSLNGCIRPSLSFFPEARWDCRFSGLRSFWVALLSSRHYLRLSFEQASSEIASALDSIIHGATRGSGMPSIDHIIVKVDDLDASVAFYTTMLGFENEGTDGPFTLLRVGPSCQLLLAPWGTAGFEHYAFAVSRTEFDQIFRRIREASIAYGPTFDSVGTNTGPGHESGARGHAPTLYFNDPSQHLLEIRSYET